MGDPNEPTHVKPGNAIRLVGIFAQPPVPTNNPNQPPSQSIVLPNGETVVVFGTLFDPPGPLLIIVNGADGSQTPVGPALRGDTGIWYFDFLVPLVPAPAWPGPWNHRWYQNGVAVDANFLQERTFWVDALDF